MSEKKHEYTREEILKAFFPEKYEDGEPCRHPGCLQHIRHPCEGCGRIAGRKPIEKEDEK